MQTSLPDLPYDNYGLIEPNPAGFHSSIKTSERTYPRTDLANLTPWDSFLEDIHQVIQSTAARANLTSATLTIEEPFRKTTYAENEEKIRAHAIYALHDPVTQVANMLGVEGRFLIPGCGNTAIIGAPDFSWVVDRARPHSKLVVEYKTWWSASMVDLPTDHARRHDKKRDTDTKQSYDALQQIYGYMTFNKIKYSILTNWQRVWFLRHAERSETSQCKTLDYHLIEFDNQPISMLKAWVGMVLLANNNWFYASPTTSPPPPTQHFGTSMTAQTDQAQPNGGQYQCLPLDYRLCHFDLSCACPSANGCVVVAKFLQPSIIGCDSGLEVVCKIVDIMRYSTTGDLLEGEASAYAALQSLQGHVIPKFYGLYEVWGILKLIALQPVGDAISENEDITWELRLKMRASVQQIHNAGYVHGDIARRNFCCKDSRVFLVDLESCQLAQHHSEQVHEMDQVDSL